MAYEFRPMAGAAAAKVGGRDRWRRTVTTHGEYCHRSATVGRFGPVVKLFDIRALASALQ
jgi:hypothetical protein